MKQPGTTAPPIGPAEAEGLFATLPKSAPLLLAVSGGPDSVALLHLCARWAADVGAPAPIVATVDHGLRAEAEAECRRVVAMAGGLGLKAVTLRCDDLAPGSRLLERARAERHRLLAEAARRCGAAAIVTAHTLDDQAETVLMRLCDGSGPRGLAGMRATGRTLGVAHHRPLLGVAKARLVATCRAAGLAFATDPSNVDARFARARWRAAAPVLEREGLTAARLGALARRVAEWADWIETEAEALAAAAGMEPGSDVVRLDFGKLETAPAPVAARALAIVIERAVPAHDRGAPIRLKRLESLAEALHAARTRGAALRRTFAGLLVSLDAQGVLTLRKEAGRKNASNRLHSGRIAPLSLGKGGGQD
jgi:tRNA(Ile)-lysidine synthase